MSQKLAQAVIKGAAGCRFVPAVGPYRYEVEENSVLITQLTFHG